MNRINEQGLNLIEYKMEFMKHHSPIVDKALIYAMETMIDKKELDLETFELIQKDEFNIEDFRLHILTKKEYTKSVRELFNEFEKIRQRINLYISNMNFCDYYETESNVDSNKITILRQYSINKEFIMAYFGIDEPEYIGLMKKKGFMEKFAALRMSKVFNEIYSEMREEKYISQNYSLVYFNKDNFGFSVDYKYGLNVDFVDIEGNMKVILEKVKEIDKIIEKKFNIKMGLNYYGLESKSIPVSNKSINKDKNVLPLEKENQEELIEEHKIEQKEIIKEDVKKEVKEEAKEETKEEVIQQTEVISNTSEEEQLIEKNEIKQDKKDNHKKTFTFVPKSENKPEPESEKIEEISTKEKDVDILEEEELVEIIEDKSIKEFEVNIDEDIKNDDVNSEDDAPDNVNINKEIDFELDDIEIEIDDDFI